MVMAYVKTEWKARKGSGLNRFGKEQETANSVVLENAPYEITEPGTPFSTANMNHIEQGIGDAHSLIALETQERVQGDAAALAGAGSAVSAHDESATSHADIRNILLDLAGLPEWDSNAHILTFTARNSSQLVIDLPIESLASGIGYDPDTKEIVLTRHDGSEIRVSVSDLIDVYEGSTGAHIQVTVDSGNIVRAILLAGAVTETELASALLQKINNKLDSAHNTDPESHPDIRQAIEELEEAVGTLVPEAIENLPELLAQKAPVESPAFTGTPTVPPKTAAAANDGTLIATEAQVALKADLANPALTGTPSAPTAAAKNNSIQIATTAYADRAGHPVGSYYTQYPLTADQTTSVLAGTIAGMFPSSRSPATLFGGTWTERFVGEQVFFKTRPIPPNVDNDASAPAGATRGKTYNEATQTWSYTGTAGIQEDAIRDIFGQAQWDLMGYVGSSGNIGDGAFYYGEPLANIRTLSGTGANVFGYQGSLRFDSSRDTPTDTPSHPRNRLIKVWKRTA